MKLVIVPVVATLCGVLLGAALAWTFKPPPWYDQHFTCDGLNPRPTLTAEFQAVRASPKPQQDQFIVKYGICEWAAQYSVLPDTPTRTS